MRHSDTELLRPLIEALKKYCEKHSADCPLGGCVQSPPAQDRRMTIRVLPSDDVSPQCLIRDVQCDQCTMIATLRAIQRNVPWFRLAAWLEEPQLELAGRTPRECIDSDDLDSVINTVWLLDESELTCG